MPRSLTDSKEQALVDEQITKLKESIRQLNNLRNTYSAISKLPAEILSTIFVLASRRGSTSPHTGWPLSKLYNFSFVSQHWRATALSTPDVWGNLHSYSSEWCRVELERAKMVDITLHTDLNTCDIGSARGAIVMDVIRNHMQQVQELTLIFSTYDLEAAQNFLNAIPASAPRLQNLTIKYASVWPTGDHSQRFHIPSNRLTDCKISKAVLVRCDVDWKTLHLRGLKHLKVHSNRSNQPFADFLDALSSMPDLEVLELEDSLPSVPLDRDPLMSRQPAMLSHLRHLLISSPPAQVTYLLVHLRFPTSATIDLECFNLNRDDLEVITLAPLLNSLLSAMQTPDNISPVKYQSLMVSKDAGSMSFTAWKSSWPDNSNCSFRRHDIPDLKLTLVQNHRTYLSARHIVPVIPLDQLKTLLIRSFVDKDTWMLAFSHLPVLETIVVDLQSALPALQALTPDSQSNRTSNSNNDAHDSFSVVPFLHLQELCMDRITFKHGFSATCRDLQKCLKRRLELGKKLKRLRIRECNEIFEGDVKELEMLVEEMDWDCHENHIPDTDEEEEGDSDEY